MMPAMAMARLGLHRLAYGDANHCCRNDFQKCIEARLAHRRGPFSHLETDMISDENRCARSS